MHSSKIHVHHSFYYFNVMINMDFQIHEILKELHSTSTDDIWLFGDEVKKTPKSVNHGESWRTNTLTLPPDAEFGLAAKSDSFFRRSTALPKVFGALSVLQYILSILSSCQDRKNDNEEMLFSTLGSVSTITDGILRKVREFLMIISVDCTTLELFEEGNHQNLTNKPKDKVGIRKKKGKLRNMKRQIPVPKTDMEETPSKKFVKVLISSHKSFRKSFNSIFMFPDTEYLRDLVDCF